MMAAALAAAVLWVPAAAAATDYVLVPERSAVEFRYTEGGKRRQGEFERFAGGGSFDAAAPESAALEFSVDSRSIELGNELVDAFAQTEEWFDSDNHRDITFRLTKLVQVEEGRFLAEGELSIRGRTLPVSAPVHMEFGADEVRAAGDLRVDRERYGLGLGASQAFVEIGREVSVAFDLIARPVE